MIVPKMLLAQVTTVMVKVYAKKDYANVSLDGPDKHVMCQVRAQCTAKLNVLDMVNVF